MLEAKARYILIAQVCSAVFKQETLCEVTTGIRLSSTLSVQVATVIKEHDALIQES